MTTEEDDNEITVRCTQGEGGESSSTCMICMEEWTIGSDHRICCLKCGHLFGRTCIERWIKEKGAKACCPTCNKPAKKVDVRDIWCKSIRAFDTSELCQAQTLLENERKLRKTDSAIIFHLKLKNDMLHKDLDKLKRDIIVRDEKIARMEGVIDRLNQLRAQKLATNCEEGKIEENQANLDDLNVGDEVVIARELKGMFHFAEKIESSPTGGCRSFALCSTSCLLLVAQPSPQGTRTVFGGFGLRKYSIVDTNIREFIPLHSRIITSIQLKPLGDLILTSAQDKKIKLTSITNNACVLSYDCQFEPTCVAWSAHRDQQFYVASGNCFVTLYDIRNTSDFIYQTNQRVANTRLLSIVATTDNSNLNGLLVNDARGCQFLEISDNSSYDLESIDRSEDHLITHQLPFEGLMGTVDFYKRLNYALITTRKSPIGSECTHNLLKLEKNINVADDSDSPTNKIDCVGIKTYIGGRSDELLSQSKILRHPTLNDSVLVGACDRESRGIKLWDSSDDTVYQTIRTDGFIRDMILYTPDNSNQHVLYALSDKGLNIYRWDYA